MTGREKGYRRVQVRPGRSGDNFANSLIGIATAELAGFLSVYLLGGPGIVARRVPEADR